MEIINTHLAYFSPTNTTKRVARAVAARLPGNIIEYNMMLGITTTMPEVEANNLFVAAVPVYSGRVPAMASDALSRLAGNNTPAIALCVYGNRAYEDALLELCDLLVARGFKPVAAAAFVARHSIFRTIAADRPDAKDMAMMKDFGDECSRMLASATDADSFNALNVRGSRPYRSPSQPDIVPAGSGKKCSRCGLCAMECPVEAIDTRRPYRSDSKLCISCGRCVEVCPEHTRCFSGVSYMAALRRMTRLCADRKLPEAFFAARKQVRNADLGAMVK